MLDLFVLRLRFLFLRKKYNEKKKSFKKKVSKIHPNYELWFE
jgi:hypothetical protein